MTNSFRELRDVGLDEVKSGLSDGSLVLVDVREPNEIAAGAIPLSVSMPLSRFDPAALPTGVRLVFSCAAGVRSRRAVELAQSAGLDANEHFANGFRGWAMAGEEIVPGVPELVPEKAA